MVQGTPSFPAHRLRGLIAVLAGVAQGWALAWPWGVASADWMAAGTLWSAWWPQPGHPWPLLQTVSMAVWLFWLRRSPDVRSAVISSWLFAGSALVATFWWLFISMHTYGGLPAPLAVVAVCALAGALALYAVVISIIYWLLPHSSKWFDAIFFASLWCLAELARGVWFTGFPWGATGYAHIGSLGWLAPWVGVYGMGAVAAGVAAGLARLWACDHADVWRRCLLSMGLLVALMAGALLQPVAPGFTQPSGTLPLILMQGNIPQDEKFQSGSGVPRALSSYSNGFRREGAPAESRDVPPPASGTASSGRPLVVAPETALPLLPQQLGVEFWQPVLSGMVSGQHAVLTGLPLGNSSEGYANAVWGITPEQAGRALQRLADGVPIGKLDEGDGGIYRYAKHHLVPFGEFIPPFFRWFVAMMDIPLGDFNRGMLNQPSFEWAGQRIAPNICYEDLFGEELASRFVDSTLAPTVLVNLSNLAWFGNTVALDQHLHISRIRALELERPMVRATNTGATVVIDHRGVVTHALPRVTEAELVAEATGREGVTPYARWAGRWGLGPVWLLAGLLSLAGLWAGLRRRRSAG